LRVRRSGDAAEILLLVLLSSAASLAQEEAPTSPRGHFYFGPGLQIAYSGGSPLGFIPRALGFEPAAIIPQ
jgi:hypothetical protein